LIQPLHKVESKARTPHLKVNVVAVTCRSPVLSCPLILSFCFCLFSRALPVREGGHGKEEGKGSEQEIIAAKQAGMKKELWHCIIMITI